MKEGPLPKEGKKSSKLSKTKLTSSAVKEQAPKEEKSPADIDVEFED